MADQTLHPYELLDSATVVDGQRYEQGDEIMLTQRRGDELEELGSVRPAGTDDSDIAKDVEQGADERDLPRFMATAQGREQLAQLRMAKRKGERKRLSEGGATTPPPSDSDPDSNPTAAQAGAEQAHRVRERAPGRRA